MQVRVLQDIIPVGVNSYFLLSTGSVMVAHLTEDQRVGVQFPVGGLLQVHVKVTNRSHKANCIEFKSLRTYQSQFNG